MPDVAVVALRIKNCVGAARVLRSGARTLLKQGEETLAGELRKMSDSLMKHAKAIKDEIYT